MVEEGKVLEVTEVVAKEESSPRNQDSENRQEVPLDLDQEHEEEEDQKRSRHLEEAVQDESLKEIGSHEPKWNHIFVNIVITIFSLDISNAFVLNVRFLIRS